jgi:hypothetical protein
MEEKNKIDEIFKSALDDLEMEPSAQSWDNVSSKLAAKRAARKKRRTGLWFTAAALLMLLSYTSYRLLNKVSPEDSEKIHQIEKNETVVNSTPSTPSTPSSPSTLHPQNNSTLTASTGSTPPVAANETSTSASESNSSAAAQPAVQDPSAITENANIKSISSTASLEREKNNSTSSGKYVAPAVAGTAATRGIEGTASAYSAPVSSPSASPSATPTNAPTTTNVQPADNPKSNATDNSVTEQTEEVAKMNSGNDNNLVAPAIIGGIAATGGANNSSAPSSSANSADQNTSDIQNPNQNSQTEETPKANETPAAQTNPDLAANPVAPVDSTPSVNPKSSSSLINRIASHLGLEVYYTPEFAKTNMKVNDDYQGPASKNLDDYKNESSQYCYSAGLNLSYKIGNHWSVVSGYSISDFSKSAVYNTMSVVADSVYQDQYVENPGGHQGGSSGHHHNSNHGGSGPGGGGGSHGGGGPGGHGHENPGHPNDPGSNCHYVIHTACGSIDLNNVPPEAAHLTNGDTLKIKTETFQTIHFYSIPLLARYSFGTKKVSYFIEAGGAINYVTTDQVRVVVNDATVEDNSLDAISNMNYTLLFGVGAKYNFFKNVNFFLKPSLRYSITPINVDSPVKSYPYYMGIGGGFSIDF